jgi:hypothetical protein
VSALTADVAEGVEAYLAQPTNFDTKDPRVVEADAFRAGAEWAVKHVDWRLLAGIVPGHVSARYLRVGDRVAVSDIEGCVLSVDPVFGGARFVVRTDEGAKVTFERRHERVMVLAVKVVES